MDDRPLRGLRGERVYLRPLEPDDAETVHRWYEDTRVSTLVGDPPMSLAQRRHRYDESVRSHGGDIFRFMICRLDDDVAIGRMDVFEIDRQNGSCAFGLAIGDPQLWGQGLGTDAVNAVWTSPSASSAWSGSGWIPTRTTPGRRPRTARRVSSRRADSDTRSTRTDAGRTASGWRCCAMDGRRCPGQGAGISLRRRRPWTARRRFPGPSNRSRPGCRSSRDRSLVTDPRSVAEPALASNPSPHTRPFVAEDRGLALGPSFAPDLSLARRRARLRRSE